jgi:hypothetical protein
MVTDALRQRLVAVALEWQSAYGIAPAITSAISEFDAAALVGMPTGDYADFMRNQTAVNRGSDFVWKGVRYQVKANRPSGKPGSRVTLVPKAKNFEWDRLIWILYDTQYSIEEAWLWERERYREAFEHLPRVSPTHYRGGERLA